ncbi:MAG TPA: hypothetical protein VHO70_14055 [Chitinispirillaceae bacterium]|nr:hypothetical protein [Chitinispirillaceae bacterium]
MKFESTCKKRTFFNITMQFLILTAIISPFNTFAGILSNETGRVLIPYEIRFKMHVNNNTAFIGGYNKGLLHIVDATSKSTPVLRSSIPIPGPQYGYYIHDIWYSNNMVYFAHRFGGVSKVNLSNAAVYSRCMQTDYTHNGLTTSFSQYLQKEVLYVADHYGTIPLKVYDPQTNQLIGNSPAGTGAEGREIEVTSDGKVLFQAVFRTTPHINVFNVQNPTNPLLIHTINVFAHEMVISPDNRFIYIVYEQSAQNKTDGVMILDITNPANPVQVNTIALPGAKELTVDHVGQRLFVRTRSDLATTPVTTGIYAYDISNLSSIRNIDFLKTNADREDFDIWYSNEYLYYMDNTSATSSTSSGSYLIIVNIGPRQPNRAPIARNSSVTTIEDYKVRFFF